MPGRSRFTPSPSTSRFRYATPEDLPALEPVIRTVAPWSRFGADPRFGHEAIIVDDYALSTCKQAVDDLRREHAIKDLMETIDWTGVYWS